MGDVVMGHSRYCDMSSSAYPKAQSVTVYAMPEAQASGIIYAFLSQLSAIGEVEAGLFRNKEAALATPGGGASKMIFHPKRERIFLNWVTLF